LKATERSFLHLCTEIFGGRQGRGLGAIAPLAPT